MADIFLSYAREDLAWASNLATALAERGWSVFWDRRIPTGKSFDLILERELDAARCVIVLWSTHSVGSDWVKGEAGEGARRGILHPAWIEDVRLPLEFRRLQTAQLAGWTPGAAHPEFDQFVSDITVTLGPVAPAVGGTTPLDAPAVETIEGVTAPVAHPAASHTAPDVEPVVPVAIDPPRRAPRSPSTITLDRPAAPDPAPERVDAVHRSKEDVTPLQTLGVLGTQHVPYVLAAGVPPLIWAAAHLLRLPFPTDLSTTVFVATAALCGLLLYLGNRVGAALLAAGIGGMMVLKPLVVPFGFAGDSFSYGSQTAMNYWGPGVLFLVAVVAIALTSPVGRLIEDFGRLRPGAGAIGLAAMTTLASFAYFRAPTVYDVYESYRPRYQAVREHLSKVASALDRITGPVPLSAPLDPALIIDARSGQIRDEDPSRTGHVMAYHHLLDPDSYLGDFDYAFDSDLRLHVVDTGPRSHGPTGGWFAGAASGEEARSLDSAMNAPYLVVVKALSADATAAGRIDDAAVSRSGPYRLFLYHLERDQVLWARDVVPQDDAATARQLEQQVYATLEESVGAKIIR